MQRKSRTKKSNGEDVAKTNPSEIVVKVFPDQQGRLWTDIRKGEGGRTLKVSDFVDHRSAALADLSAAGVPLLTAASQNALMREIESAVPEKKQRLVADQPGWCGSAYVMQSGDIVPGPGSFHIAFEPRSLNRKGSIEGWNRVVRDYAKDQPVLTLALGMAFAGPLLTFLNLPSNVLVELTGPSSIGKTTALNLAASVWGAPEKGDGSIVSDWNSTLNALWPTMAGAADGLLLLDERNLLAQAGDVQNAVFRLAEGTEKRRHGSPTPPSVKLAALSTSNDPLSVATASSTSAASNASLARFLTVPAQVSDLGIWKSLPKNAESGSQATHALKKALRISHGHAGTRFVEKLAEATEQDEKKLRRRLAARVRIFMSKANVTPNDGVAERIANSFAAIYAAAWLAGEFNVLPLKKHLLKPILACFESCMSVVHAGGHPSTPVDEIERYLAKHGDDLIEIVDQKYPSKKRFKGCPGVIKEVSGRRCLVIDPKQFKVNFGFHANNFLKRLKAEGRLLARDGLQLQTKVYKGSPKARVYAIVLDCQGLEDGGDHGRF